MMNDDRDYYRARCEEEKKAAAAARNAGIAEIHLELAANYQALVDHPELRGSLNLVGGRR